MYNIAVCDDDLNQLERVRSALNKLQAKECIGLNVDYFTSGEDLIKNGYDQYDIAILDVEMHELSGLEVAKLIREKNKIIQIIFATSHQQYWPEGYGVNAFRYLIKPIEPNELINVVQMAINNISHNKQFIVLKEGKEIEKVIIADIKYLEIMSRKVVVHTKDKNFVTSTSMNDWRKKLENYPFSSPHNSYLVNFKFVKNINQEEVTLISGEKIYISQRKYQEFKKAFLEHINTIC